MNMLAARRGAEPEPASVRLFSAQDGQAEAWHVVEVIQGLVPPPPLPGPAGRRLSGGAAPALPHPSPSSSSPPLRYSDMAVVYRTHTQSRVVEEALVAAGLPYVMRGATPFYERAEVKDLLAYLR